MLINGKAVMADNVSVRKAYLDVTENKTGLAFTPLFTINPEDKQI
jgi:hypothetical protein